MPTVVHSRPVRRAVVGVVVVGGLLGLLSVLQPVIWPPFVTARGSVEVVGGAAEGGCTPADGTLGVRTGQRVVIGPLDGRAVASAVLARPVATGRGWCRYAFSAAHVPAHASGLVVRVGGRLLDGGVYDAAKLQHGVQILVEDSADWVFTSG